MNLQRQGFKEPTQEENGYTGDLVCTDCHTIVEAGEVIDKLPVTPPEGKPEPEIPPVVPDKPPVMLEGDKAEVSKNQTITPVQYFVQMHPLIPLSG